jgi:hypothetical protein
MVQAELSKKALAVKRSNARPPLVLQGSAEEELAEQALAPTVPQRRGSLALQHSSPQPKRGLSVYQFCEIYDICRAKAYQEIAAGRLVACKIGRRTVVSTDDAEDWFAALPRVQPAAV